MPFGKGDKNINRKGAPKRDWTWAGVLETAVQKHATDPEGKKITVKELVAESLINEAKKGNVIAQKELMNRMDGMPLQQIDQNTDGKLEIIIVEEDKEKHE